MKITYHGHAFVEIDTDVNILIDPFITGNPLCKADVSDFNPDFIFLTHGHRDHYGDTEQIAKSSGCTIHAMAELARWISSRGFDVSGFNIGGSAAIGRTTVNIVNAVHSNSSPDGSCAGLACGFVIEYGHNTVYHAGDTSLFSDMSLIGKKFDIDLAFLPIGGTYTMDIHDAVEAAAMLSPSLSVPVHFNTFRAVSADPDDFMKALEKIGLDCRIMNPGDYIELNNAR